jgi:hypothetical protein
MFSGLGLAPPLIAEQLRVSQTLCAATRTAMKAAISPSTAER